MKNALPQEKIQVFLDILEPLLRDSMPKLVDPSPSHPLLERIPALLEPLGTAQNTASYQTIHAALLLLGDDLNNAHTIVQNLNTPHAAGVHAIIHRREGDFWNSNYWWRRAQSLPWAGLPDRVAPLLKAHQSTLPNLCTTSWSPSDFTDAVEEHHGNPGLVPTLVEIQRLEWKSLLLATVQHL